MKDYLILVDDQDTQWGKLEKQLVHELGLLHRAFSVFIFNSNGELLIQQRADDKYHSGGLWTNSCCSHPRYGEDIVDAIPRRLMEEIGISCDTHFEFQFLYKTNFTNGLIEHELDHVYFGVTDQIPTPDNTEVKDWRYINLQELESKVHLNPEKYTTWMKICLPRVKQHHNKYFKVNRLEHASN